MMSVISLFTTSPITMREKVGVTIEQYISVSKLRGATTEEGSNNYYADLINRDSSIIYSNNTTNHSR